MLDEPSRAEIERADARIRTADPFITSEVLYQLSYVGRVSQCSVLFVSEGLVIRRFEDADERREFELGFFELLTAGDVELGRASYEPGWKWSTHVGPTAGTELCEVAHVGIVLSGRAAVEMRDGTLVEMGAGDVFVVPPGHDSWVIGDEPYVSIHLVGADSYATADS